MLCFGEQAIMLTNCVTAKGCHNAATVAAATAGARTSEAAGAGAETGTGGGGGAAGTFSTTGAVSAARAKAVGNVRIRCKILGM